MRHERRRGGARIGVFARPYFFRDLAWSSINQEDTHNKANKMNANARFGDVDAQNEQRTRSAPLPLVGPCGEGLGVGVVRSGSSFAKTPDPPPQPSPTASRACPTCASYCATGASPG